MVCPFDLKPGQIASSNYTDLTCHAPARLYSNAAFLLKSKVFCATYEHEPSN